MKAQKCPVCFGKTQVPAGFYDFTSYQSTSNARLPETCKSCGGKGIVMVAREDDFYGS